jgi:hypothetical protein
LALVAECVLIKVDYYLILNWESVEKHFCYFFVDSKIRFLQTTQFSCIFPEGKCPNRLLCCIIDNTIWKPHKKATLSAFFDVDDAKPMHLYVSRVWGVSVRTYKSWLSYVITILNWHIRKAKLFRVATFYIFLCHNYWKSIGRVVLAVECLAGQSLYLQFILPE